MKAMVLVLAGALLVAVGWAQSGGPKPPGGGGTGTGGFFTLQGRVTDATGHAVKDAVVKATSRNTATTDATGSYAIVELPKSVLTYNVSVSKPGLRFSPDRAQVHPPSGTTATLNFQAKDPKTK